MTLFLAILTVIFCQTQLLPVTAQDNNASVASQSISNPINPDQSENNIAFDLPDLTATIDTKDGGEFQIEAYKSINNDRILSQNSGSTSQLFWVSVGQPKFVKTPRNGKDNTTSLFHFNSAGFYTYIEMLSSSQRRLLAAVANTKYGINVSDQQVVNLILSKLECSLTLFDDADNKYMIIGRVTDFRQFPLRMDFRVPRNSMEMKLFRMALNQTATGDEEADLHFLCTMASKGKLMKTNTLVITLEQMQQIGLVEKLFGESRPESVYVARSQMTDLASEMYSTLNIVEDYQMSEAQFSDAFLTEFISQASAAHFSMVSVDSALETLSTYGFNVRDDIRPDVIKRDLGSIMKVENYQNKSHIIVNEAKLRELERSGKYSGGGDAGFLGFQASVNFARENTERSKAEDKSLDDQLREVNLVSQNDVKWEIEGERIIPKTVNVARLSSAKFSKSLVFKRVRIQTFSAAFNREFGVYTSRNVQNPSVPSVLDQLTSSLTALNAKVDRQKYETDAMFVTQKTINQRLDNITAQLSNSIQQQGLRLDGSIRQVSTDLQGARALLNSVSASSAKRCRVCFRETEGSIQCQGNRNSCSGWSSTPSWTQPFRDDTDNRRGGCTYQWMIECQV